MEVTGIEPATPCLQSRCSNQLSYTPEKTWVWEDLNLRPLPYQSSALTS